MRLILLLACTVFMLFNLSGQKKWEIRNPMPDAAEGRHHPVTFSINGFGYVMTGGGESGELKDAYKYEAATESWTEIDSFPGIARSYAYGLATEGKGYVGFGLGREANGPVQYFNDLWEFDPISESWKQLADCPCEGRSHPALVATKDKIFVGLGNSNMGNFKDWWEYDIASDSWSQKPDFPNARRHHPYFFEIDGLVYVAFGHGDIIYNDLHVYNPEKEEWKFLNFLPSQGRVAGTQFSYNGKGYVLSGDGDTHDNLPQGEMWRYDPVTNEWEELPPHPGPGRWAPGCFVIEDEVFFTGGDYLILYNDLISFNLSDEVSTQDETNWDLSVFPNPSSGLFTLSDDANDYTFKLLDGSGKFITQPIIDNNQLDLSAYPEGGYILVLEKDSKKEFRKLIVTH